MPGTIFRVLSWLAIERWEIIKKSRLGEESQAKTAARLMGLSRPSRGFLVLRLIRWAYGDFANRQRSQFA